MALDLPDGVSILIQGVHLIVVEGGSYSTCVRLRIFDLSRRGCSTFWEKGAVDVRTAWYKGGREIFLEESEGAVAYELDSLGDGTFFSLVSQNSVVGKGAVG